MVGAGVVGGRSVLGFHHRSRTMKLANSYLVAAIAFLNVTAAARAQSHDDILGKPDLVARDSDKDLKTTIVAGSLLEKQDAGKSYLWCGTLQLAWNQLCNVMGPPLTIDGPL